jgi:hypothetical protein
MKREMNRLYVVAGHDVGPRDGSRDGGDTKKGSGDEHVVSWCVAYSDLKLCAVLPSFLRL